MMLGSKTINGEYFMVEFRSVPKIYIFMFFLKYSSIASKYLSVKALVYHNGEIIRNNFRSANIFSILTTNCSRDKFIGVSTVRYDY